MSSVELPLWWDREVDRAGKPVRPDVRNAAHAIWSSACRLSQSLNFDSSQTADLMEKIVFQVSRYLDRRGVPLFSREINGLLMLAFQRGLYRSLAKFRRLETLGGTEELSSKAVDQTWTQKVDTQLELEQLVRSLNERTRTILALRYAGYTWKESARLLGTSVSALRSGFWREVDGVREKLNASRTTSNNAANRRGSANGRKDLSL